MRRALAIDEKALGADHPDVAKALSSLALLYDSQRRFCDAEPLIKRWQSKRKQAAVNAQGIVIGGKDIEAQADQAFLNLSAVLQSVGCDAGRLVKSTVFIRDMDKLADVLATASSRR